MEVDSNASVLIFEQLNKLLLEKSKSSNLLDHNLEKGLANEQILREMLAEFLPAKYGVAKGKVINPKGKMSKQCDIIIYDKFVCPTLFIDDNRNQILPMEGVYFVIEVKTTLDKTSLAEAFDNLSSVYDITGKRCNRSINDFVDVCPPGLTVIAFNSKSSLETLAKHYKSLTTKHLVSESFHSFTKKSPGYAKYTGEKYLVDSVVVLTKGIIHHMHHGELDIMPYDKYTLGVYLTGLIMIMNWIELPKVDLLPYFNWSTAEKFLKRSQQGECLTIGGRRSAR